MAATRALKTLESTTTNTGQRENRRYGGKTHLILDKINKRLRMTVSTYRSNNPQSKTTSEIYDDGRFYCEYTPSWKGYIKKNHSQKFFELVSGSPISSSNEVTYKYLGVKRFAGRKADVLQQVGGLRQKDIVNLLYLDASNHLFLGTERTSQEQSNGHLVVFHYVSQVEYKALNVPIPASIFQFHPPKGVKRIKTFGQ